MLALKHNEDDLIKEFLDKYSKSETTLDIIKKHREYNTQEIVYKDGEIIGYARYNIDDDIVTILNVVIHPKYYFKKILLLMLLMGMRKYFVKYIKYERRFKNRKEWRTLNLVRFLGIKNVK